MQALLWCSANFLIIFAVQYNDMYLMAKTLDDKTQF